LRQHAREVDALALAAAERLVVAPGELLHVEELHQLIDRLLVGGARAAPEVRVSAHHDDLADGQRERDLDGLREHGAALREFDLARALNVRAPVLDAARVRAHQPREHLDESRFARPVRADYQMKFAGLEPDRHAREERTAADAEGDVAGFEHPQNTYRRRRSSRRKTGTPTAEVTMPMGSSAGRSERRAIKSARLRSVAPVRALPRMR
jgi:hypothetical protein